VGETARNYQASERQPMSDSDKMRAEFDENCACGGTRQNPQPDDCERCRFVVEVDRLKTELYDCQSFYEVANTERDQLRAELAAAKAASVLPVEIQSVHVNPYREVVVSFDESCTAQRFADWVRQIKERGER